MKLSNLYIDDFGHLHLKQGKDIVRILGIGTDEGIIYRIKFYGYYLPELK